MRDVINKILGKKTYLCRIEKIDFPKKIVIISFRGMNFAIKINFNEIIMDSIILSNLSPKHASWIGFYYGKYYCDMIDKRNPCAAIDNFYFFIESATEKFNSIMLDRYGDLIYLDIDSNITRTASPINIMRDEKIIMRFDPIQACYIGILAGTSRKKKMSQKEILSSNISYLRLVK